MANKTIGYTLMGLGLIVFALSYPGIRATLGVPIPANIGDNYILILGLALLLGGAFIGFRKSGAEQPAEIPIYEGQGKERKLVGIQRLNKK